MKFFLVNFNSVKMANVQFSLFKVFTRVGVCNFSCLGKKPCTNTNKKDISKTVFISQSNDVFTNLALEYWLYKNCDFTNKQILMLWRNDPCVVIGRFQNPWLEASIEDLPNITENGIKLARRNSGGGTMYHDCGNLNLTFFTNREAYNRKHNLELITRAIFREYSIKVDISTKEDLVVRHSKISGTASKLGMLNAFHHCSLLINTDKADLSMALSTNKVDWKTNATRSIKSKLINLCDEIPKATVDKLLISIGWEYMRTPSRSLKDGGMQLAKQQNGFQFINPTEAWFPGLQEIRNNLISWEWCYGKTPEFTVTNTFSVPVQLLGEINNLTVTIVVEEGRISDVTLFLPQNLTTTGFSGEIKIATNLNGHKFTEDTIKYLEKLLSENEYGLVYNKDMLVTEGMCQAMTSV